ncbi:PrgI family protein [Candidatus Saccharibacteria bacterium]|nr:PrgI family protein [Candidatus Saccharibacteria bacterium]
MAQYKVPQDVEADDKLLGPFNFRQFIYLLIVAALIALAWVVGQIFPFFAIIPVIPAIFLLILALPLRKDQPMETYVAAIISFHLKPNKRCWRPGQRESTIRITVPKTVEKSLTKDITEEEAGRRLSFLANVVDSEGLSIKEGLASSTDSVIRDEFIAEAESTPDIFENYHSEQLSTDLSSEADLRRAEIIQQMRAAIAANNPIQPAAPEEPPMPQFNAANLTQTTPITPPAPVAPAVSSAKATDATQIPEEQLPSNPLATISANHERLVELSKNKQFTIATIAKEANRASKSRNRNADRDEVYISLHHH